MAGLDRMKASDFIGMLQHTGGNHKSDSAKADPVQTSTDMLRAMQMASDCLLLRERDQPLSVQTVSGCCDTVVAKRKEISICIAQITNDLETKEHQNISKSLATMNETMLIVIETCAHVVYLIAQKSSNNSAKPSIVDSYKLHRARLAIEVATNAFNRPDITPDQVLAVAAVVSTHLDVLRNECNEAQSKLKKTKPLQATIFESFAKGLSGSAAMLVAVIKALVKENTKENREAAKILSKPVIGTVDALIQFVQNDTSFSGQAPSLTREASAVVKPLQAAAVSVSSACTLMVGAVRTILTSPRDQTAPLSYQRYASLVDESLSELVTVVKKGRDTKL